MKRRYDVRLAISLTQREMDRLAELAKRDDVSIAHVVRTAIRAYHPEMEESSEVRAAAKRERQDVFA